jgi:MoaA/NifB/PqqE/SkfB family radical SAM enzyme
MTQDSKVVFLDRIDELGITLFGERNRTAVRNFLQTYRAQVYHSYEQDFPEVGPRYALLKVTNHCNSGCSYCNHSKHANSQLNLSDVPTENLKKVVRELADLGVRSVNLSGGEPLLRSDLPDLISYTREQGLISILLSNGLIFSERWEELGRAGLNYIILSLDSLDAERYQRQRGASFDRAWNGFEAALRMRDMYPPAAVHITSVITEHNLEELTMFVRKMASYDVGVQFTPYHHFDRRAPDCNTPRDLTEVQDAVDELISMQKAGYPIANSGAYLDHIPAFFAEPQRLPEWYHCYAAYVGVFVDAELNVRPCWSWSLPIVGNLGRNKLKDVWYSRFFNQQRAEVRKLECSRCWLLCTAELSIRFMECDKNERE